MEKILVYLKYKIFRSATLVALAFFATPAFAHHSGAMFDATKEITLSGTVKEFQWTNPHSWIQLLVVDDAGKTTEWSFESESPAVLVRSGIKRTSLNPGDKISIKAHPLRDGRPGGAMMAVTLADGTRLTVHKTQQESPDANDAPAN